MLMRFKDGFLSKVNGRFRLRGVAIGKPPRPSRFFPMLTRDSAARRPPELQANDHLPSMEAFLGNCCNPLSWQGDNLESSDNAINELSFV